MLQESQTLALALVHGLVHGLNDASTAARDEEHIGVALVSDNRCAVISEVRSIPVHNQQASSLLWWPKGSTKPANVLWSSHPTAPCGRHKDVVRNAQLPPDANTKNSIAFTKDYSSGELRTTCSGSKGDSESPLLSLYRLDPHRLGSLDGIGSLLWHVKSDHSLIHVDDVSGANVAISLGLDHAPSKLEELFLVILRESLRGVRTAVIRYTVPSLPMPRPLSDCLEILNIQSTSNLLGSFFHLLVGKGKTFRKCLLMVGIGGPVKILTQNSFSKMQAPHPFSPAMAMFVCVFVYLYL